MDPQTVQTDFYLAAIVFMGIITLLLIGLMITALVIKSKISKMQRKINEKVDTAKDLSHKAMKAFYALRYFVKR